MNENRNLRMTRQRRAILETLSMDKSHPTVEEVYSKVRKRMPSVSLGTVYRNLETLANEGLIQRMDTSGNRMRFDGDASDHEHIRCVTCHRIDDLRDAGEVRRPAVPEELMGFKVLRIRVEIAGLCPECRDGVTDSAGPSSAGETF